MCLGLCASFSPRISSTPLSRYYLHVFPISLNCLAPPHFPESPHRAFIPQCIGIPHYSCFLFFIRSSLLILFPVSLPMSSKSCICIFHLSMSVGLSCFDFVTPPPTVCFLLCIVYVWSSVVFIENLTFWF